MRCLGVFDATRGRIPVEPFDRSTVLTISGPFVLFDGGLNRANGTDYAGKLQLMIVIGPDGRTWVHWTSTSPAEWLRRYDLEPV